LLRVRVTYGRVSDFLRDVREQLVRGGLLVRVDPGPIDRGAAVEIHIVTPAGSSTVAGEVLQILAGAGVAVGLDAGMLGDLILAADAWSGDDEGPEPSHQLASDDEALALEESIESGRAAPKGMGAAQAAKIQQALHGDKNQRMAILRENNKMLHAYVLRNPQIQLDEVIAIARMTTVSVEVLTFIAGRREWAERAEVASALVRNPKTPVPLAIRMLDHIGQSEIRQLAKQTSVREAIQRAARKKILG